jgi:hypothetical protein
VDVVSIDQMVVCGMIGAPSCSSTSWYSMSATRVTSFPSLSRIKIPKPPPLIPLKGLGGPQAGEVSSSGKYVNSTKEQGDLGAHCEAQSSELTKYNLRPRARGSSIFLGGVEGGWDF